MAATPVLLLMSGSILIFPIAGRGIVVDFCLAPADGLLELASLGGVGAELVLGGGVLSGGDLDGDLDSLFPANLGGDMTNRLAMFSSSSWLSPKSAVVFSIAPLTFIHRSRNIPRLSLPPLSDMNSTVSLN